MTTTRLEGEFSLLSFPFEILHNLFLHLGPLELLRLEQVSHLVRMVTRDKKLWVNIAITCYKSSSANNQSLIDWRDEVLKATFYRSQKLYAMNFLFHFYNNNISDDELRSLTHNHLWTMINGSYIASFIMNQASQKILDRLFLIELHYHSRFEYNCVRKSILFNLAIECNQHNYVLKQLQDKYESFSSLILYPDVRLNQTPLHIASARGQLDIVMALLQAGAPVDPRDDKDVTPLMMAASKGHLLVARALLFAGADIEARDREALTPLRLAIINGHDRVVGFLLKNKVAIVDPKKYYISALSYAAKRNKVKTIEILLAHGAMVNCENNLTSPLSMAAFNGHLESVKMLLSAGVDVEGKPVESEGSPLFAAAQEGFIDILEELLKYGASIQYQFKTTQEKLEKYANDIGQIEVFKYYIAESFCLENHSHLDILITPFDIAVLRKKSDIVEELVKHVQDPSQLTCKLKALSVIASMNADLSTLKVLDKMGVDFNYKTLTHKRALTSVRDPEKQPGKSCMEFMTRSVQLVERRKQFQIGLYHACHALLFTKVVSPLLDSIKLQTGDSPSKQLKS